MGTKKEDAPLLTKSLRQQQKLRQMSSDYVNYPVCRIRFNLPNQIVIDIGFHPGETITTMKAELTKLMIDSPKFDIFVTPPKKVLEDKTTLWENGLCPRGACYTTLTEVNIKPELWETRLTPKPVIDLTPTSSEIRTTTTETPITSTTPKVTTKTPATVSSSSSKKVPKWFKGTGKSYK